MPVTLSLVARRRRERSGLRVARELGGDDLGHFVERRDEAVALAGDLDAFADREDVGIAGAHRPVDDDAAIDGKARLLGERCVRPDADGHDDEVGGNARSVLKHDAFDLACRRGWPWCCALVQDARCRAPRSRS